LNYPLYQALGADFAVDVRVAGPDTTVVVVHDVAAGAVRRTFRQRHVVPGTPGYRLAVHRLSDQILQAALGAAGIAATRILFVKDGKVYRIDQDGAEPTWSRPPTGRRCPRPGPGTGGGSPTWNSPGGTGSCSRRTSRPAVA
jgi:hypothetical protein